MGCKSCGAGLFDPAPISPQAIRPSVEVSPPTEPVQFPTLFSGVMIYPENGKQPESIDGFERTSFTIFESVMPPCRHRYEVKAVERDGLTTVKHTCLHGESGHTNQYVTKSVCNGCPLRKGLKG